MKKRQHEILVKRYEHTAYSLPKRRRGEQDPVAKELTAAYPRVDHKGRAVFQSKREVEEFQARTGHRFGWDTE